MNRNTNNPAATSATTETRNAMHLVHKTRSNSLLAALLAVVFLLLPLSATAQTSSAALSGIVADETGARIPGATLVLVNQQSKDKRTNTANADGAYNFSGLKPGVYTLTVTYKGFETFVEKDIALHPGDSSALPTIPMKIGEQSVTIAVSARDEVATNGEVSSLITSEDIKHLATEGRDVTELVKILPGFALQPGSTSSGGLSNAAPDTEVVGPGGALGNYAATGAPSNGVGLISDGANVQDPGAGGASTQTINMDMVEEVKVSTSNFGADVAKGPVVINAVGKSGGQDYHGSVYIIARITQLNSNDWLLNDQGLTKPPDRYLYPGGSIGGPVKIPGTNFNHDKKLLFEVGGEDYVQRNAFSGGSASSALRLSTVPTDAMRGMGPCTTASGYTGTNCANFSTASIAALFNVPSTQVDPANLSPTYMPPVTPPSLQDQCTNTGTLNVFTNYCLVPAGIDPVGNSVNDGNFPTADIDPGAMAYLRLFPHQNRIAQPVAGTTQPSDGFDRIDENLTNYNLYQIRGRLDYNASQNNKFYVVYNTEQGTSYAPYTFYYNPNYNSGVLQDPSKIHSGTNSQTASFNYVRIFGASLTNELFGAVAYYVNPFSSVNQKANEGATYGYTYDNALNNGSTQIPDLGYSSGLPLYLGPDFSLVSSFSRKVSADFGDNLTKVYRNHTIKVGFYFERTSNNERVATGPTQGQYAEYGIYGEWKVPQYKGGPPTGVSSTPVNGLVGLGNDYQENTIANFLQGFVNSYSQQNQNPIEDLNYKAIDGYVTDSWKVSKKLTLTGGVRFDHLGPWTDPHGNGVAFWNPKDYYTPELAYNNSSSQSVGVSLKQLPGITWHGINHNVSDSAELGRWAFVSPRAGFAYDMYGDGRTVFTGGVGMYRSHDSWNDYVSAESTALGTYNANYIGNITSSTGINTYEALTMQVINQTGLSGSALGFGCLGCITAQNATTFTVADPKDSQQPLTTTYSFGVNQAFPHAGNLIVNYVGNQSSHLLLTNAFASNVNAIPVGGLFRPNPNIYDGPNYGSIVTTPDALGGEQLDDYRPYPLYSGLYELRHGLHSTYNSMQVTWSKWNGPFHYNFNYTWSKALGDRGADGNGSAPDATNFRNDYGIAAYDRTHVFNASYSYIEGNLFHGNRFVGGVVNGWEISGILNLQSGPNLQASFGNNFGLTSFSTGQNFTTDNKSYLGTPDVYLQPVMTCDPSVNLRKGQFINGNCLTLGAQGINGPFRYPYLRGPAYFHTDLSGQKSFHLSGKKEVQFRFAAFNFVNHPLTSLVAATANPLRLVVTGPGMPANSAFGISDYKEGRRICEIALHYIF
jgi:hypothetical protein